MAEYLQTHTRWGFPGGSDSKEFACNSGDLSSIPGSGRSPWEGNGNSLQYSCLENPMDGRAWWATVHRVSKSQTTEWLNWTECGILVPKPGIEPMCPALAGGFLTTGPPGKSSLYFCSPYNICQNVSHKGSVLIEWTLTAVTDIPEY